MSKKFFMSLLCLIIFIFSTTLISCENSSKKITISDDTKSEIIVEENEINKNFNSGEKSLNEGNFDEAKSYFNKAISLDKLNKDIYLKIKDKYLSFNRFDDAYFVIKTALTNNVDAENMKLVLEEISANFDVIKLNTSIYQNSSYILPTEVNTSINGVQMSLPIYWDNSNVNSTTAGTFIYKGLNEEYGRKVEMEITVLENIYDKQIGYIKDIYESNGKLYMDVDLVEFYFGQEALNEAIKDNNAGIDENGKYFLMDPYYIRNRYSKITTYEISSNCSFALCRRDVKADVNSIESSSITRSVSVTYDVFFDYLSKSKNNQVQPLLSWIELKNGSAYSIYKQYTP
ncbi:hypothetical protein JCM1393_05800 [Clostridium carnis]